MPIVYDSFIDDRCADGPTFPPLRAAKTLSLASVFTMTDAEAEMTFRQIRWPETDGEPVCPHCGGTDAYDCRRPNGAPRFRCRACGKDFSITSGTLFASHKLPLRCYLAAIAIFCNEVKGKSALALSRDLERVLQGAFVLLHKMREAMAEEMKGRIDRRRRQGGGSRWRLFRRLRQARQLSARTAATVALLSNQTGKRKVVVVVRERDGNSLPAVFRSESHALDFIRRRVAKGTTINADEAGSWEGLHDRFEVRTINHQEAYSARRRLHELGRGIFQPHAPRRDRAPSPYRGRLFAPVRARGVMARG